MTGSPQGCGAPAGGFAASGTATGEAVIEGQVTRGGTPAAVGYARLLNHDGEFAAEVPLGADGGFRFFAATGTWTVRVLVPGASADQTVNAERGSTAKLAITV